MLVAVVAHASVPAGPAPLGALRLVVAETVPASERIEPVVRLAPPAAFAAAAGSVAEQMRHHLLAAKTAAVEQLFGASDVETPFGAFAQPVVVRPQYLSLD